MSTSQSGQDAYAIVVGVDYSELGDLALERAFELAKGHARTHLHVVHVEPVATPGDFGFTNEPLTGNLAKASTRLHDHVEAALKRWFDAHEAPAAFERLTTHIRSDGPAEAIAQLASDVEADLVVVGTHGHRGAKRFFLGSVAEGTVRLAPCAVLVVRPPDATVPKIEPPCPLCLETRRATNGKEFWCEEHREHHKHHETHHFVTAPGARQSGLLIHVR